MNGLQKYMMALANRVGFQGEATDDGWQDLSAEKGDRPLPELAVLWNHDEDGWCAWIGDDRVFHNPGDWLPNIYDHPSAAFMLLRKAVDAYEWPVCKYCDDTGLQHADTDHFNGMHYTTRETWACEHCWHGEQKQEEADRAEGLRAEQINEALDRR